MALDLSGLDAPASPATAGEAGQPNGKPLMLAISLIDEDPDQPRKEFDQDKLAELSASIKKRGVKSPISVRPHPTIAGRWMLNFGARRLRGSKMAGKKEIPAFVDEMSEDFDQVIENEQRQNLSPMELALFIQKKLDAGLKKKEIAEKLSKDNAAITQHLALIGAPECIEAIYRAGKCTSPATLYMLRALHEKEPEKVEAWCEAAEDVTRKTVSDFADELKGKKPKGDTEPVKGDPTGDNGGQAGDPKFDHDQKNPPGDDNGGQGADTKQTGKHKGGAKGDDDENGPDTGELTSWPRGKAVSDPDRLKKPLLLVEYDKRAAAVLLNRRPTDVGMWRIRFEDGSGDMEVDMTHCKPLLLKEQDK